MFNEANAASVALVSAMPSESPPECVVPPPPPSVCAAARIHQAGYRVSNCIHRKWEIHQSKYKQIYSNLILEISYIQ